MVMAAASLLARTGSRAGSGDSARARGQPLPVHRLPEHRRGGAYRSRRSGGIDGHRETLTTGRVVGMPVPRKEDKATSPAAASSSTTSICPDRSGWLSSAAPTHTRGSARSTSPRRKVQGVNRRVQRRGARRRLGRLAACAWPVTGRSGCTALPARLRQGASRGRQGRSRGGERARSRRTRPSSSRSSTRPLGAVTDVARAGRRRAACPRRPWDEQNRYVWKLDAGGIRPGLHRRRRGSSEAELSPAAADPRGDGASAPSARRPPTAPTS